MKKLLGLLKIYGLKDKEARVYLAALGLGSAPVTDISRRAGLARSTTYVTLEALQERGFISTFKKRTIKWFIAEDPKTIIELGKQKVSLLEASVNEFNDIYNKADKLPNIRTYRGKEGVRVILEEILRDATELFAFSSTDELFQYIETFPEFVKRRIAKKIPSYVIAKDSEFARGRKAKSVEQLRQMKLISGNPGYHGTVFIWNKKVAIVSPGETISSIIIESEEMMAVHKAMFKTLWDVL